MIRLQLRTGASATRGTLLAEGETTHIVTDSEHESCALPEKYLTVFRAADRQVAVTDRYI